MSVHQKQSPEGAGVNSSDSTRDTKTDQIQATQGEMVNQTPASHKRCTVKTKINNKGEKVIMGATKQLTVTATPPIAIKISKPPKYLDGSTSSSLHHSAVAKFMHQTSAKSSGSFGSRINIVTESCSLIPSTIASTFSLEEPKSPALLRKSSDARKLGDLGEAAQVSTSCQENLEQIDILEDPAYTDTIQSTDSAASLLRRTFSLPHDYHYSKQKSKHAREIFLDFYPHDGSGAFYSSTESAQNERDISGFRQTMEDLLEKPEYIDSLESSSSSKALLAKAALSYAREVQSKLPTWKEEDEILLSDLDIELEKKRYMKNLVILSLCYMMLFTSFLSLRNLQSSINNEIGLESLCIMYASLLVSCVFTTTVVQRLRPRNTMIVCFGGFVIYVMCNFYPHYYTLLPASAIAGFCIANSYTAQATYLANIAISYASISGKSFPIVLTKFNGIYYMFFQLAQIIGGVISSVVLTVGESPDVTFIQDTELNGSNTSLYSNTVRNYSLILNATATYNDVIHDVSLNPQCGANYCPHSSGNNTQSILNPIRLYTLVGILTLFGLGATTLLFFFLDPLEGVMKKTHSSLSNQITACFRFFLDIRVVCLLPLMFYSLLQVSFMFGEYSKAFVTCSSGVHMVGYVMLTISSFCACSSYVNSKLAKHLDRKILLPIGYSIHVCLYIVMLMWSPSPSTVYMLFIIAAVWGLADGIFVTQVISLIGVLFMEKKESAYAGLKMCQAAAVCVFFSLSPYLCTSVKIYIMMTVAILAATGYGVLEVVLYRQQRELTSTKVLKKVGPTTV